jgi:hypothetical protein
MPLSLIIYENLSPEETYPLLATQDPDIIAVVRRLLMARLGDNASKVLCLNRLPGSYSEDNPT